MVQLARNLAILLIIVFCAGLLALAFHLEGTVSTGEYSKLVSDIQAEKVAGLSFTGMTATVRLNSGDQYRTTVPDPAAFIKEMALDGVSISFAKDYSSYYFQGTMVAVLVVFSLVVVWSLAGRKRQDRDDKFASTKLVGSSGRRESITFDDVAGVPEAKEELLEIVTFLKDPGQFSRLGAIMPKGLLLQGPPGTGKTLLARAVAGEAGVPFYSFSGSDFVEMFVGVGASRVRDLFREAKKNAPCIVFIDEIDGVGSSRVARASDGQDERGQTLNALLVEMDGFSSTDNIIVVAATNRPDILDPALSRPGRFDRRITILPPDVKGRVKILDVHCRKVTLSPEVDLEEVAQMTSGFSGAEIASLVNEAALLAGRDRSQSIGKHHFDMARDRVMLGVERKGMILTELDKMVLAYHEAGHAIVAKMLPKSDPVHKISIIPRGRALGQTQQLPLGDRTAYSKQYLMDRITILMGGQAAEKVVFNSRTTHTENDILQATEIAMNMVCRWGMSEVLGPRAYRAREATFLGEIEKRQLGMSNDSAQLVDREIKRLLIDCYKKAEDILQHERFFLKTLSEILFQVETLDADEFDIVYRCSLTRREQREGRAEIESECSMCPAKGSCIQYNAN